MEIGKHIKNNREKRGMSQKELSNLLRISNSALSNYENDVTLPPVDILINIADIFGITLDELAGRENVPPDTSKTYIPILKSLSENNIFEDDNIKGYFSLPKSFVKFKSFLYQAEDDLFYNLKIGRGDFILTATDASVSNGDTIIYSLKQGECKAGLFNYVQNGAIISDFNGKAKFIDEKSKLKIKGVVTHIIKRLK